MYIFSQRSLLLPLLTTFDFSDTTLPCAKRDVTTVAPQALALLNNAFVHQQSAALADRVLRAEPETNDNASLVARAWRLTLGRDPTDAEVQAALGHLTAQAAHFSADHEPAAARRYAFESLCHVLVNANEFIYVD